MQRVIAIDNPGEVRALSGAQERHLRRIRDAFGWWDLVFGNAFPSYG